MAESSKLVISSHLPFATGTDLVEFRDWRHVADLLNDDDTRPGGTTGTKAATVAALDAVDSIGDRGTRAATAQIESACYRGNRYTRADLQRLLATVTDVDGTGYVVGKQLLVQLTCDLWFWILTKRRKPDTDPRRVAGVIEALAQLEALRVGEAIFPLYEAAEAAQAGIAPLDPNQDKTTYLLEPLSKTSARLFGVRSRSLRERQ
jgi:hypothetical protein